MKCLSSFSRPPAFPALLLEAGTSPRALGSGNSVPSELCGQLPAAGRACPALASSVSPALGGTAVISTILASAGTSFGSLKAAPSLVTQGAGPWERAYLPPERTRNQVSVQPLD